MQSDCIGLRVAANADARATSSGWCVPLFATAQEWLLSREAVFVGVRRSSRATNNRIVKCAALSAILVVLLMGCGQSPIGKYSIDYDATIAANGNDARVVRRIVKDRSEGIVYELVLSEDGTFSVTSYVVRPSLSGSDNVQAEVGRWSLDDEGLVLNGNDGDVFLVVANGDYLSLREGREGSRRGVLVFRREAGQ